MSSFILLPISVPVFPTLFIEDTILYLLHIIGAFIVNDVIYMGLLFICKLCILFH